MLRPARAAAALATLLILTGPAAAGEDSPDQAAQSFYRLYLRIHPLGIPGASIRARFRVVLSPSLNGLLAQAAAAEARHRKATKGSEPPLVEGDLFTSLFEGASAVAVKPCEADQGSGTCAAELSYLDPRDKTTTRWTDRLLLTRSNAHWVVDDIEYGGTWDFARKGRLKDELKSVLQEAQE